MKWLKCCLLCCLLLSACSNPSNSEDKQVQVFESQAVELQEKVSLLEKSLEASLREIASLQAENERIQARLIQNELQMDLFPLLSNLSLNFVRAHTRGDAERLRSYVGDSIHIQNEEGIIFGSWEENGQEIKWVLWREDDFKNYDDMVIQGFGLLGDGRYAIHIREFYTENGIESSPPTFLSLHFQKIEEQWKIVYFEFDV